jgi:hypothetical protein
MGLADVRPLGRDTQGVALMRPGEDAHVIGVALVVDEDVAAPGDGATSDQELEGGDGRADTPADDPTAPGRSSGGVTSAPDDPDAQ